jgi:HSP20 family protein
MITYLTGKRAFLYEVDIFLYFSVEGEMSIHDLVPWNWGSKAVPVRRQRVNRDLESRFSSLFDDFFEGFPMSFEGVRSEQKRFVPRVNVKDTEEALLVSAEVPGMDEADLDITLDRDSLIIKGEKKFEKEESEKDGYHYVERHYGSFQRVVPLQVEINEDDVKANFKNGVLSITLPKTSNGQKQKRKISLQSN